jgi:hypothetical protein
MNDTELRRILSNCKTIAVVGLSADPSRPSHRVAHYMQQQNLRIVPVNPSVQTVLGETSYARLEDIPFPVDMVDVFRKPAEVLAVAHSAVAIGAKCFWQQMGLDDAKADALVRAAGMDSVMDRCWMVEHARLCGP